MNTIALQDYRRIWNLATRQRDARHTAFMHRLVWLLALGGALVALVDRFDRMALARIALAVAVAWFAIVWAALFLPGAVMMNSAANARLVPRQRRRLLQMTVAGWLVVTAGFSAAGGWALFPLIAAYALGFLLLRAAHPLGMAPMVLAGFWPVLARHALPPALVTAMTGTPGLVLESVLMLLLAAWSMPLLLPAGGDRHLERRAASLGGLLRLDLYARMLRHDCMRAKPGRMLLHALGPAAHWSITVAGSGFLLALGLGLRLALLITNSPALRLFMNGAASAGLASMAISVAFGTAYLRQQLDRTRAEQGLLRLTPRAGAAAPMNRCLAQALLRTACINWAMLTAAILAVALLVGGDGVLLLRQAALCCLAGQMAMSGLLGDFAHDWQPWAARRVVLLVTLGVLETALAVAVGWYAGWTACWALLAVLSLAGAGALVAWRWRSMLAAAPAFPAGRLEQPKAR